MSLFVCVTLALVVCPFVAKAAPSQSKITYTRFIGMTSIPYTSWGTVQTALRAGDTPSLQVWMYNPFSYPPTISADFSQLGILNPITALSKTGIWNDKPSIYYDLGPFNVGQDVSDGLKTISVTAVDWVGGIATTTVQIVVDNVAPTLSFSDITFSKTPPGHGDYMYLSGKVDGTGSKVKIAQLWTSLFDAVGNPMRNNISGGSTVHYDTKILNDALVVSTDGSFSNVPIRLLEFGDLGWIARATNLRVDILGYDEAGNFASTSLTVLVPKPIPPDPCIATNSCASNVLFLPGIEASRLYEGTGCGKDAEEKLWEPFDSFWSAIRGAGDNKVRDLFLNQDGDSICDDIYTKENDILDSVHGGNIYESFIDGMDELKADGTIKEWKPIAYDWRLSLDDLLNKGSERDGKIFYEEATSTPYIEQTLRALANISKTGKVTIVAHSNGGLVAKALLNKLGSPTSKSLVDKVILVGAPQSGAPVDVGALLYGLNQGISSWGIPILHASVAQELAENSPMAYHLLPSQNYFDSVADDSVHPVVSFAGNGYSQEISAYDTTINNKSELDDFLIASSLNSSLIDYANVQHSVLDSWAPPAGIEVSQIAGWGSNTVTGIDLYTPMLADALTALEPPRAYRPIFTEDGDGTVTVPSALMMASSTSVKRYWVDLISYYKATKIKCTHADLFEIPSLQDFIKNIIKNSTSTLPSYISSSKPATQDITKKLSFFLHSPLTLQLTDSSGNITGLATDDSITENIPGSTYGEFGEVKYITVPEVDSYHLTMHGQASGSFSLDTQETTNGVITASSTIAGVPTTASTTVSMDIQSDISTLSPMNIDKDGNGSIDFVITPKLNDTVLFDTTPPELQISFSTTTKSIAFIGIDDMGATTLTSTTTYPVLKKNQKEYKGIATTTVIARDEAGNTTTLIYTEQLPSPAQRNVITLYSLAYGSTGSPQVTSLQATVSYKWRINKKDNSFNVFASNLRIASTKLESHYRPKKNKTIIMSKPQDLDDSDNDDNSDMRPTKQTLPGMVVPYMTTEEGSLIINY